jgi:hypothetical protein
MEKMSNDNNQNEYDKRLWSEIDDLGGMVRDENVTGVTVDTLID